MEPRPSSPQQQSSASALERLRFRNVALRKLPVEDLGEEEPPGPEGGPGRRCRTVHGACFSRVRALQPLPGSRLVAVSPPALALLGLSARDVLSDPAAPLYLSGSRLLPGAGGAGGGSEPAAHCYAGHQYGLFAGQLGDGAALYLGEVEAEAEGREERWEIQAKGAGVTPYSRDGDGRKVLRSSIREFLCSEAMAALGVPTTRAASLVTSDLYVSRDPLASGRRVAERCSVVLRVAPSFIRFGSFEIFLPQDDLSGICGPSAGRHDIRAQMLDYVIETFYGDIHRGHHGNRKDRNTAFFKEVATRTAKLVAQWQCVGFCHGVLNTDNMSILGLTLDYGPFGFMDRFDPEYVCNASDKKGRYSYRAQPSVCRWNLARLADALGSELHAAEAGAALDGFMPTYEASYLGNMRRKLGLLEREEAEDAELVSDLLRLMHNTGADFTNTFRLLSRIPWPEDGDSEGTAVWPVVDLILEQCASIEELKHFGEKASQENISNVWNYSSIDTLSTDQEELRLKQRDDWTRWTRRYRKRLARESHGVTDVSSLKERRVSVMDHTNPRVVLRNYIAHNAIQLAEKGDFSGVRQILEVLEHPFSEMPGFDHLNVCDDGNNGSVPYDSRPPAWAREICVT